MAYNQIMSEGHSFISWNEFKKEVYVDIQDIVDTKLKYIEQQRKAIEEANKTKQTVQRN